MGDVEKNAFKLMEAINASGVYKIVSREGKILHCIEDAIGLKVKGEAGSVKIYDLDKLRDLHSKLVLISGTATKPKEDKFLAVGFICCYKMECSYYSIMFYTGTSSGASDCRETSLVAASRKYQVYWIQNDIQLCLH